MILDTSAYSWFAAGHPSVRLLVSRSTTLALPVVALGELLAGFALGVREQANRDGLQRFIQQLDVRLLLVDDRVAERYATLALQLRRLGRTTASNDIWIAATTLSAEGTLLTFDSDFARIPGLDLILLQP